MLTQQALERQTWADLPPNIRRVLELENITIADWRRLGARRRLIFGITRASVALIDAAAKAAQ
jgi:hypothetical protein